MLVYVLEYEDVVIYLLMHIVPEKNCVTDRHSQFWLMV